MPDEFENNKEVICRFCIITSMNIKIITFIHWQIFTTILLDEIDTSDVEKDKDNLEIVLQDTTNSSTPIDENKTESNSGFDSEEYYGTRSAIDVFVTLKDMKDNDDEISLEVGGVLKKYRVTFDPDDNLCDIKQVSRGNLIKRIYTEEESKKKWREKLFGYDVYWGYLATHKKIGYICPAMICDENGASTGLILKRILRTRCNAPQLWMVIYSVADDQCYIMKDLVGWMNKNPETNEKRKYWTNPGVSFNQEICSK